jgi:hypothetical protein
VNLDPGELGWNEFWLRIIVITFLLLSSFMVFMIVSKVVITAVDLARWLARKITGEDEEEMSEDGIRRALLGLIPQKHKGRAAGLLQRLLQHPRGSTQGVSENVYVSEYDGQPSRVHTSLEAAQGACVEHLKGEVGSEPRWDWFADDYGWIMRYVDPETNWPGPLLGGRVTKTCVER